MATEPTVSRDKLRSSGKGFPIFGAGCFELTELALFSYYVFIIYTYSGNSTNPVNMLGVKPASVRSLVILFCIFGRAIGPSPARVSIIKEVLATLVQCNKMDRTVFYQDNDSAIKMKKNDLKSSGDKTRHINIRYVFIKDV